MIVAVLMRTLRDETSECLRVYRYFHPSSNYADDRLFKRAWAWKIKQWFCLLLRDFLG